jgi:hypothetical protein
MSICIGFSPGISLETQDEIEDAAVLCVSKSIGSRYLFTLFYVRCEGGLIGIRRVGGREVEEQILMSPERA